MSSRNARHTNRASDHAESSAMASRRNRREMVDQDLTDNENPHAEGGEDQEFQARTGTASNRRTNSQDWTQTQQGRRAIQQKEQLGTAATKKIVADVIKMALSCAHRRVPLKKDEINKNVLKKNTGVWAAVYQDVQSKLRTRFGMELVELRVRAEAETVVNNEIQATATETQQPGQNEGKKRADAGENGQEPPAKKRGAGGTKSWVVRSSLGNELISLLNEPKEIVMTNIHQEERGADKKDCGALLDWSGGDGVFGGGVALKGILFTILALILVRDRAVMDTVFMKLLSDKLNLNPQTILPFSAKAALSGSLRFDEFLSTLTKQGYLQKIRIVSAMGGAGNGQDAQQYEWKWGSRADAEIGEQMVCEFMLDIAGSTNVRDQNDNPPARRPVAIGNPAERKEMKTAISKAAGSVLLDIAPA